MTTKDYQVTSIKNILVQGISLGTYLLPTTHGGIGVINIDKIQDERFRLVLMQLKDAAFQLRTFLNKYGKELNELESLSIDSLDKAAQIYEAVNGLNESQIQDIGNLIINYRKKHKI